MLNINEWCINCTYTVVTESKLHTERSKYLVFYENNQYLFEQSISRGVSSGYPEDQILTDLSPIQKRPSLKKSDLKAKVLSKKSAS